MPSPTTGTWCAYSSTRPGSPFSTHWATRIQGGLTPRQLLAALAVATCREVSPYPNVGFKYHAVMMLRSVEQSVVAMSKERAWLPLLWTADYFKAASAQQDRIEP